MIVKCLLLLLITTINLTVATEYFRVKGAEFEQKINDTWVGFGKFAGVNLGITSPGHLPGEIILRKHDYIRRFKRLDALNVKVIRVYSLLHPDFYDTLMEWNQNHAPIYVLHGTAFPEEKFYDGEEGSDLFREDILQEMKDIIDTTVNGVLGNGRLAYRHEKGDLSKPIYETYTTDISRYLLGFVVGGEISPHTVYKTNQRSGNPGYYGMFFETNGTKWFESWVAEVLDHAAVRCSVNDLMVPISQTNWVTLDGIKNPVESRFFTQTNYSSEEDWQELDSTLIKPINGASFFYNEHIYPYYPEFLTYHQNGTDGYYDYLKRLKHKYNDKPFIITEIGISTSIGQASSEEYGRNHGGVSQQNQGKMMNKLILDIINEFDYYGVIVFQLHDEWFKRSWNTQYFDADGPSRANTKEARRQVWHNVMSAEEGFGIYEVVPKDNLHEMTIKHDLYDMKVSHNEMYLTIEVTFDQDAEVLIAIDNKPDGSKEMFGMNKHFNREIDSVLKVSKDEHKFFLSSGHDLFLRQYGWWLQFIHLELGQTCPTMKNIDDDYPILKQNKVYHVNDFFDYSFNFFNEFRQIVKLPSIIYPERIVDRIDDEANHVCLPYSTKPLEMDRLVKTEQDNNLVRKVINLPYHVLGYGDPSQNEVIVIKNQGSRIEYVPYINTVPMTFEITYSSGGQEQSIDELQYELSSWDVPKCFCERAKLSFTDYQSAFGIVNKRDNQVNDTFDECVCIPKPFDLHTYLVLGAIIVLFIATAIASFGTIVSAYYHKEQHSYRLMFLNLIAAVGLAYLFFVFTPTSAAFGWAYSLYILLLVWDSLILLMVMSCTRWNLHEKNDRRFDEDEHVFVIACHNSSSVINGTLQLLLEKVRPEHIYVADNGSSKEESEMTKYICEEQSLSYQRQHPGAVNCINYGCSMIGNKTIAQFAAIKNLPSLVKYATCIDDDTRLDRSWDVHKTIRYFEDDEEIAVLAYPLSVWNPRSDLEWFQAMEYLIVGYIKIFHSKVYSTIFNSGAFGTYRVDVLKEALLYHNTDHHGDDLQICMNIHQLKGKTYYDDPIKKHTLDYKVVTATDMIVSTIAPKCWFHLSALSKCFQKCKCDNPDLFSQRCKGWFVSQHRFIPRYIKLILNVKGFNGTLWVRLVALYELLTILNEYFAIVYIVLFLKNVGVWLLEGFLIAYAINVMVMTTFYLLVLRKNNVYLPYEMMTMQLVLYKLIMIVIYRYAGLLYNLFVYTFYHRSGELIINRLKDKTFVNNINAMFSNDQQEKSRTKDSVVFEEGEPSISSVYKEKFVDISNQANVLV